MGFHLLPSPPRLVGQEFYFAPAYGPFCAVAYQCLYLSLEGRTWSARETLYFPANRPQICRLPSRIHEMYMPVSSFRPQIRRRLVKEFEGVKKPKREDDMPMEFELPVLYVPVSDR